MIKVIFWDFDGVLIDSNSIRDIGFEKVLCDFPKEDVNLLLEFHRLNGGLSRYVKFRYFFEVIRKVQITDEELNYFTERFSTIMREFLVNRDLLITETVDFLISNQRNFVMHVTSGSDQEELKYLCKKLKIEQYFKSIHGSPKPKKQWISELINDLDYNCAECVLIGDSINDFDAAVFNRIHFQGYNSDFLISKSTISIF